MGLKDKIAERAISGQTKGFVKLLETIVTELNSINLNMEIINDNLIEINESIRNQEKPAKDN